MTRIRAAAALLAVILLVSCDRSGTPTLVQDASSLTASECGARLSVKLGTVGVLARSASGAPTQLRLQLQRRTQYRSWENVQTNMYPLSGSGDLTLFYPVSSAGEWRFYAVGLDAQNNQVYDGVAEFRVVVGQTVDVSMLLGPNHSTAHLKLPVLDSMTRFVVKLYGSVVAESTVVKQTRVGDTIRIQLDDLEASADGHVVQISIHVYGEYWNREYTMFALDDTIRVVSGVSRPLGLSMAWVGPTDPPQTQARVGVTFGGAGNLDMQAMYQSHDRRGDGSVFDARTGQTYWYQRFGSQVWMTRNIGGECFSDTCRQGQMFVDTHTVVSPPMVSADIYFESDTGADFRTACPVGWHVPDTSEWRTLVRFAANGKSDSVGAHHLRSLTGWTGIAKVVFVPDLGTWMPGPVAINGDDSLGFGLYPTRRFFSIRTLLDVPEAELWTSTPGVPVAHFDYQGNFSLASGFNPSYSTFSRVDHRNAAVRCLLN